MTKPLTVVGLEDATLVYLFGFLMVGFVHIKNKSTVKGLVFGIWRFQLQCTLGYSDSLEDIGEIADA